MALNIRNANRTTKLGFKVFITTCYGAASILIWCRAKSL